MKTKINAGAIKTYLSGIVDLSIKYCELGIDVHAEYWVRGDHGLFVGYRTKNQQTGIVYSNTIYSSTPRRLLELLTEAETSCKKLLVNQGELRKENIKALKKQLATLESTHE